MLRAFPCRSRRPGRSVARSALVLAFMGCAPWASIPPPAPVTLPPTTQLQVYVHGRRLVLRDVNISADSVRGRVVDALGRGASVVLPRSAVDTFQIRTRDSANWFGAGFGAGILIGVTGILALMRAAANW